MTRYNNLSKEQAEKLGLDPKEFATKKRKYGNNKPVIDGITFDSHKEANYYAKLKMLKKQGYVEKFELQPEFVLLEPEDDKVTGRGIKYIADFKIWWDTGKVEVVDVKGYKTNVYKLKKKWLLYKYPDIDFREE